jgi:hypothetical protein
MPAFQNFKIGGVQSQIVGLTGPAGHGFNITNDHGSPLLSIIYPTAPEAQAARDAIEAALANAIAVATPGS